MTHIPTVKIQTDSDITGVHRRHGAKLGVSLNGVASVAAPDKNPPKE